MTLRHMRIFVTVCTEQGITRAAEKLHIAQPSVSIAIRELEEYYGVKLFDRISKKLYLTDMGENFLEYAAHIVALFDEMEASVRRWEHSARLKIGASITVGTHLMPRYVDVFCKRHPQAKVEVFIGSSESIEKKILQNALDFAFIEGSVHSDSLLCQSYRKDRLVVLCGPEDPLRGKKTVTIENLLERPLLLREPGSGTRELFDNALAALEYSCTPAWESTSTEALIHAAGRGLGVSVLPYLLAREALEKGEVAALRVKGLHLNRGLTIIYHRNKLLTSLAREFIALARDFVPDET